MWKHEEIKLQKFNFHTEGNISNQGSLNKPTYPFDFTCISNGVLTGICSYICDWNYPSPCFLSGKSTKDLLSLLSWYYFNCNWTSQILSICCCFQFVWRRYHVLPGINEAEAPYVGQNSWSNLTKKEKVCQAYVEKEYALLILSLTIPCFIRLKNWVNWLKLKSVYLCLSVCERHE